MKMDRPIPITLKSGEWIDETALCYIVTMADRGYNKGFITGNIATSKSLPHLFGPKNGAAQLADFQMWFNEEVNGFEAGFDIEVTVILSQNEVRFISGKPLLRYR